MTNKFNISMDSTVFDNLNDFCKSRGVARSTVIAIAVSQYIKAQEEIPKLKSEFDQLRELIGQLELTGK